MSALTPHMAFLPLTVRMVVEPSESSSLELLCSTTRAKHTDLDFLSLLAYRKRLFGWQREVLFPLPDILFSSVFLLIHRVLKLPLMPACLREVLSDNLI